MDETSPGAGPRRATLGDLMILIIAFGAGLALALRPLSDVGEWYTMITPNRRSDWAGWWTDITGRQGPRFLVFQGGIQLLSCFLGPLTPALLVARLCQPRPAFRNLICQPGLVASAAACLVTIIGVDVTSYQLVSVPSLLAAVAPGAAVLASWSVLVASGRWRPEASWIDRSGRFVGAFWVATIPWSIWLAS